MATLLYLAMVLLLVGGLRKVEARSLAYLRVRER
jgi:hypothetical protein